MDSVKCLRRRLRVSTEHALVVVAVGLALAAGTAAAQSSSADTARGQATLAAFLDGVRSLTADFKQEVYGADQHLQQTDTGTLSLERPNRFRWSYVAPTKLVVVADGSKLWMYDVELSQVTVAPLDETLGSSPAMLLSGDARVREGFEVVQTYEHDGLDWVKLVPKAEASDFSSVLIGFDGNAPRQLELVDGLNEKTRIELANVVVNADIADTVFEFRPPAGVDVIGGDD
jgi:outer membrane lipoprotein carrier protein